MSSVPGFCAWDFVVCFVLVRNYSWRNGKFVLRVGLLQSPPSTLAGFMYKNYGPSAFEYLSHWTMVTWDDLHLNWPTWGSFEIPKLFDLGSPLEKGCKTKQSKWEAYFNWHFEASKWVSYSQTASLQDTNSKLSKANSELSQILTKLKETTKCSPNVPLSLLSSPAGAHLLHFSQPIPLSTQLSNFLSIMLRLIPRKRLAILRPAVMTAPLKTMCKM